MVIETKPSFVQFYETRFDDITGIHIGADQAVESSLTSRGRLALTHISNCLRDWVLCSHPFAGVSARTAQFHTLWHQAIRELEPQCYAPEGYGAVDSTVMREYAQKGYV